MPGELLLVLMCLGPAVLIGGLLAGTIGITVGRMKVRCCARCRYPTEGLAANVCPECGGTLVGRGVLEPHGRIILRSFRVAAVCFTVLLLIPVAIAWVWASETFPRLVSTASARAQIGAAGFPLRCSGSGACNVNNVSQLSSGTLFNSVSRTSTNAEVRGPGGTGRLRILDGRFRAECLAADGTRWRTADGFSAEDVLRWLRSTGIPLQDGSPEARAVFTLIQNVAAGGGPIELTVGSGNLGGLSNITLGEHRYTTPRLMPGAIVACTALALWIAGIADLRRRCARTHSSDARETRSIEALSNAAVDEAKDNP